MILNKCMNNVSVIMPSLNVVDYIQPSINSVLSQTLKDIEIICVDAGSTDGTLEILRDYEKKDNRIKVIVSDIKSYGYQMNLGIQAANGKYIGIVETDDFVDENMFAALYKLAEAYDVDFVKSGYKEFVSNGVENIINYENVRVLPQEYVNKRLDLNGDIKARFIDTVHIWSGLYRKDFLIDNNIKFNETKGASFQDTSFSILVGLFADSCIYTNDAFYCYRVDNEGSSVKSDSKINCIIDEFNYLDRFVDKDAKEAVVFELNKAKMRAYSWNYNRLSIESGSQFREQILEEMKEFKENETFYQWLDSNNKCILDDLISDIRVTDYIDKAKTDMAHLLIDTLKKGCRYSIVSAGTYANRIMLLMKYMKVDVTAVYDNSAAKTGNIFNGHVIEPLENISNNDDKDNVYIVANKNYSVELKKQLKSLGVTEENIKVFDNLDGWLKLIDLYKQEKC